MATKAQLRRKIRRLKKRELELIIECNAARARAGEAAEALDELVFLRGEPISLTDFYNWAADSGKLDG